MSAGRLVWWATGSYAALYTLLGWDRYATFRAGSDVGLFTQSVASALAGLTNTPEGGSHFTVHFSPILYLCAPFVLATHSALALIALQALAGALVAPSVFALARRRVPARVALGVALVALAYPPLAGITFADFHENGFAPAAVVALAWALDARRFGLAALFLLATLAIKEDQAIIVAFGSLVLLGWFALRRDRAGVAFAAGALAAAGVVFVGFFEVVRPLAGARDVWGPTHFYTWSRIVDPRGSAPWTSVGRPAYALEAFVPLLFVPFFSPAIVFALPGFAEVLGSHESIVYTMGQHYAGVWIGEVLVAFALAIGHVYARDPRLAGRLIRGSLVVSLLVLAFASPTHWGHYLRLRTSDDARLDRTLAALPRGASVGTSDEIFAHLGFDPHAQLGLAGAPRFVLFDRRHRDSALTTALERAVAGASAALPPWPSYRLVRDEAGIELFERRGRAVAGSGSPSARRRTTSAALSGPGEPPYASPSLRTAACAAGRRRSARQRRRTLGCGRRGSPARADAGRAGALARGRRDQ